MNTKIVCHGKNELICFRAIEIQAIILGTTFSTETRDQLFLYEWSN